MSIAEILFGSQLGAIHKGRPANPREGKGGEANDLRTFENSNRRSHAKSMSLAGGGRGSEKLPFCDNKLTNLQFSQ